MGTIRKCERAFLYPRVSGRADDKHILLAAPRSNRGPHVPHDGAPERDGHDPLRRAAAGSQRGSTELAAVWSHRDAHRDFFRAGTNLILHDELRRGGVACRVGCGSGAKRHGVWPVSQVPLGTSRIVACGSALRGRVQIPRDGRAHVPRLHHAAIRRPVR